MHCFTVASIVFSEKFLASKFWAIFVCCFVCESSDCFFPPEKPAMEFSFMHSGFSLCQEQLLIAVPQLLGAGSTTM